MKEIEEIERGLIQDVLDVAADQPMVFVEIVARRALLNEALFSNMIECLEEFMKYQGEQLAGIEALAELRRIMDQSKP